MKVSAFHNWKIERFTFTPPVLQVTWRGREYPLYCPCGNSDRAVMFKIRDGGTTYLAMLSFNPRLDYVGLAVYEPENFPTADAGDIHPAGEMFTQGREEYESILGPTGLDLEPVTMARRLFDSIWSDIYGVRPSH